MTEPDRRPTFEGPVPGPFDRAQSDDDQGYSPVPQTPPAGAPPAHGQEYAGQDHPPQLYAGPTGDPNQGYPAQPYAGPAGDPSQGAPNQTYGGPPVSPEAAQLPSENVGRGLALALLAIPVAAALTAVIWRLGFIASISMFILAALAVIFYRKGSGGVIRKGIPVIIAVILVGILVSFYAAVATDLVMTYNAASPAEVAGVGTVGQFVGDHLFTKEIWTIYGKNFGLFILFAALGTFGVIMRIVRQPRA